MAATRCRSRVIAWRAVDPRWPNWDTTAHKARERSLGTASERLDREILSGLQEGVVVIDTVGRVVVANDAAAALFGVALGCAGARCRVGLLAHADRAMDAAKGTRDGSLR